MKPPRILLVEDNETDIFLLRHAFQEHALEAELQVINDGGAARELLLRPLAQKPELIILDINLPKVDGFTLLGLIRQTKHLAGTPVVILTSSQAQEDRKRALTLGADRFLTKSGDLSDFLALGGLFKRMLVEAEPQNGGFSE